MSKLDKDYIELTNKILKEGVCKESRQGVQKYSLFGETIKHNMSNGFPLITIRNIHFKSIVTELLWFMKGKTDLAWLLENNCHIWTGDMYKKYISECDEDKIPKDIRLSVKEFESNVVDGSIETRFDEMGHIYGFQWRNFGNDFEGRIDQLLNAIELLKTNPDSTRILVSAWNPIDQKDAILPPCHTGFQFYSHVLSEKQCDILNVPYTESRRGLSISFNMRSSDFPLGFPFNIASYALLLEIVSDIVNMTPFSVTSFLGDVHIYENQYDAMIEISRRDDSIPLPKIKTNTDYLFHLYKLQQKRISVDEFIDKLEPSMFSLKDYNPLSKINIPLSN